MSLAALVFVWPADALAQRGRGGRGGGRVARPVVSGRVYRPVYRPVYYRPYYGSYYGTFFWGGYGWYPYYPYWFYPSPYAGYYRPWYDDLGALRVQVKPREAQVYVDGYFAGLVDDFDGFSQRLRAKPGEHEIEIYLEGYQPFKEKMLFRPGSTLKIKHDLQPLAPGEAPPPKPEPLARPAAPAGPPQGPPAGPQRTPPRRRQPPPPAVGVEPAPATPPDEGMRERAAFGTLSIRVQPRDAVVLIDGERWEGGGARDRLNIEVAEGTHRVEVQKDGFTTYATEVQIRRGQVTTLNVSLLTAREI